MKKNKTAAKRKKNKTKHISFMLIIISKIHGDVLRMPDLYATTPIKMLLVLYMVWITPGSTQV